MTETIGTRIEVAFAGVVDGDTIHVMLPAPSGKKESIRLMCLDTEESRAGGSKPVTPWGKKTKQFAERFFQGVATVTLEFPGNEPFSECLVKHRDNYDRLLAFVHKGDIDYQEVAIREGYSPYFMKYGHAPFTPHRLRYEAAEREAQWAGRGVWNQLEVNDGVERRNYALLATWWQMRGDLIDHFLALRQLDATLLDARLDYQKIRDKAQNSETVTVFGELRNMRKTRGGDHMVLDIGSEAQPFSFFVPNATSAEGVKIVHLLLNRYVSGDDAHPRRNFIYLTGKLSLYPANTGDPQMVLESVEQLSDSVSGRRELPSDVAIRALLPNPSGPDRGAETVTLKNKSIQSVSLEGWKLRDLSGHVCGLGGKIAPGEERELALPGGGVTLNNSGDTIVLLDKAGRIAHEVSYQGKDIVPGKPIRFI